MLWLMNITYVVLDLIMIYRVRELHGNGFCSTTDSMEAKVWVESGMQW